MRARYLVGPVSADRTSHWQEPRSRGECLCFNARGDADVLLRPSDSWDHLLAQLPPDWLPDFLVLDLAYTTVPSCIWEAPVPLIALAIDAQLQWHFARRALSRCQLVLTDMPTANVMHAAGIPQAEPFNLFGLQGVFTLPAPLSPPDKDIDILFVGNLNAALQGERLSWLARLSKLAGDHPVVIAQGVRGKDYRDLMLRSRIAFNRSIKGEWNLRVDEACSCGALLFAEADNREMRGIWTHGVDCIFYDDENLETMLKYYLSHEEERQTIARAGQVRAREHTFAAQWADALSLIDSNWDAIRERLCARPSLSANDLWKLRIWQAMGACDDGDPSLGVDLDRLLARRNAPAWLFAARGVLHSMSCRDARGRYHADGLREVAGLFYQAAQREPSLALAALNLVEALAGLGQRDLAVQGARRLLASLDTSLLTDDALDTPHFPAGYDRFRAGWEEAAWSKPFSRSSERRAKIELLRWRLHAVLAQQTGELVDHHAAALAFPRDPTTQAALGCALARNGRQHEAVPYLRAAAAANPFDVPGVRALYQALTETGQREAADQLARERWLMNRAAPALVPLERWFAASGGDGAAPAQSLLSVRWEGPFLAQHSLGLVNRRMIVGLAGRGHEVALLDVSSPSPEVEVGPERGQVEALLRRAASHEPEVTVRQSWPPRFGAVEGGRLVMFQMWEYGTIPRDWLAPLREHVDEVWVPSAYVREGFIESGVPAELVHVVPLGVAQDLFRPGRQPLPLPTRKKLKLLFVGGTIHRKGIDVLLEGYRRAFTAHDDVCLVVKDMGVGSFYKGQTAEKMIDDFVANPSHPEVIYLQQPLDDEGMAALYAACDCLVHPYRGEGFGLPIAEAMSCSLPVVVTGYGAALDFVDESVGWLIPAQAVRFPDCRFGDLQLVEPGRLAEPDIDALARILREVCDRPEERYRRGRAGRERVLGELTWEHSVAKVEQRLLALRDRPLRRSASVWHPPAPPKKPGVSLCVIAKNEEHNIADCLACVRDLVQEMVVVDTGSTDRTREIARDMGALVSDFPWVDNFAAARNACLERASHEWIFWLDADDRVDDENREKLRSLFASLSSGRKAAYSMKCRCLPDASEMVTVVDHVRLFRNDPRVRWKYRIHEQILGAVKAAGGEVLWSDIVVNHTGYVDPALRARKLQRDLRLLEMEYAEQPDDAFTLFNLGASYAELGRFDEAVPLLEGSLGRSHPADSIVRKLYALLVACARQMGQRERALDLCRRGLAVCPDDAELLLLEGMTRTDVGDLRGAKASLLQLLTTESGQCFASVVDGLRTYRGRHQLAVVCRRLGDVQEAEAQWRQVLHESPGWPPACAELARLYLETGRPSDVESILRELERHPQGELEADLIRSEAFFVHRDWSGARTYLERAIERRPDCVPLLSQYSFALLQEDRDHVLAQKILLEVLRLDPANRNARNNLEVLRQRRDIRPDQTV